MIKLLTMIGTGIPAIIAGIIAWLGRKFGVAAASVATMLLLTAAMIACINTIVNAVLVYAVLPAWLGSALGALIPGNFSAVLAAIVSSRICGAAFDLAMGKVKVINSAN